MDAPPLTPPSQWRPTRRGLLRLAGAGAFLGLFTEGVRVFALTNKHTVIPDKLYRSAQLNSAELQSIIAQRGIRTVMNLRGVCPDSDWYQGEVHATHLANVSQEDICFSAKRYPAPNEMRRVIEVLDHAEKPILIHCQRGADRTGLVAAAAILLYTTATLPEARHQLWPRFGHIRGGRTIVMDEFFEFYEAWLAGRPHSPALFREWVDKHYCPGPYRAELSLVGPANPTFEVNRGISITIRAKNTSIANWTFRPGSAGGILLRGHLYSPGNKLFTAWAGLLEATVPPGASIDLVIGFPPIKEPGRYMVHADLLDTQPIDLLDADFVQYGSEPLVFEVFVK